MSIDTGDLFIDILDAEASLPLQPGEPWAPDWAMSIGPLVIEVMEGPPGPAGPPGTGTSYQHTQSIASNSWTVTHNLGVQFPDISVFVGGVQVYPSIDYNMDIATITFPTATTGVAFARR